VGRDSTLLSSTPASDFDQPQQLADSGEFFQLPRLGQERVRTLRAELGMMASEMALPIALRLSPSILPAPTALPITAC
jgi:hypothetical protein